MRRCSGRRYWSQPDRAFTLALLILTIFGLLMVFSASMYTSSVRSKTGSGYTQFIKQAVYVVLGLGTLWLSSRFDYRKFDKINHAGHLCFMKNVPEINELFKVQAEGSKDFKEVLFSGNVAFDELDMNKKAKAASVKLYDGVFAADIMNEKGMQVVDKEHIEKGFKIKTAYPSPKNYHYQIFVSENGRIIRYYRRFFKVKKDEFCYMHYRLELPVLLSDKKSDTFIVSFKQNGFFDFDIKSVQNLKSFMKTVKTYNTRKPIIVEKFNALINKINGILKKGEN